LSGKVAFRSIVHPADRDTISAEVERALLRHRPFQLFYRIERVGGGTRWVHECGHGVYDRQGRLTAIEGFVLTSLFKRAEQKPAAPRTRRTLFAMPRMS
jgi:PAS domain-containing protein